MFRVPNPPDNLGTVTRWCREIYDYLISREDIQSPNTLLTKTSRGTGRTAIGGGEPSAPSSLVPVIFQWDPDTHYLENDLAFADTIPEQDDGTLGGLFQTTADIPGDPSNEEPAVDTDNWRMIARGHWPKFTMRVDEQQIQLDAGRDASGKPYIKVWLDSTDDEAGSVLIDLADLIALRDDGDDPIPAGAGNLVVKLRITRGSDESTGTCRRCVAMRSEWFD